MNLKNNKSRFVALASLVVCIIHPSSFAGKKQPVHSPMNEKKSVMIRANENHEYCVSLQPGNRLSYRFEATAELKFNIHYHNNKQVMYETGPYMSNKVKDEFRATQKANYCWMWTNTTAAKQTLHYKVKLEN
jgi:hypothetical protein